MNDDHRSRSQAALAKAPAGQPKIGHVGREFKTGPTGQHPAGDVSGGKDELDREFESF